MTYTRRVRNDEVCTEDHDTAVNATWYGGDAGHDFYHCDECGARISIVVE